MIMQNFYYPSLQRDSTDSVPYILGLTASPVLNAKAGGLDIIEQNLNAISKTPKTNRQEMMQFVHPPVFKTLLYHSCNVDDSSLNANRTIGSLVKAYQDMDITQDPYVLTLASSTNANDQRKLKKALLGRKTYCQDQMKRFCSQSRTILDQLGPFACNYYIRTCISQFLKTKDPNLDGWIQLTNDEKKYLSRVLHQVEIGEGSLDLSICGPLLSPKAELLIDLLVDESVPQFAGLVFVEQRATVAVLSHIISIHPRTRHLLECGTFVGTSMNVKRTANNIGDLLELRHQKETLDDLRSGRKNLIITTNVLEEGIDVSACHIVISFDKPANLKSFIQRRGRARKEQSKFVLMLPHHDVSTSIEEWSGLEAEMIRTYQDDMRRVEAMQQREAIDEDAARSFFVESTGALLTMKNVVAHLYHFCATLPASPYVSLQPEFIFEEDLANELISARIVLPIAVDASVREAAGLSWWKTEKNAKKDAAFQAYLALYQAGLINDHLLPLLRYSDGEVEANTAVEKRPALMDVAEQWNPWVGVARQWQTSAELFTTAITIKTEDDVPLRILVLLPCRPPELAIITLHWNQDAHYYASAEPPEKVLVENLSASLISESTYMLLSSIFRSRMKDERHDFAALFTPTVESRALEEWQAAMDGTRPATDLSPAITNFSNVGLVRDQTRNGIAHILRSVTTIKPTEFRDFSSSQGVENPHEVYLEVIRMPKRADFLHPIPKGARSRLSHSSTVVLAASTCEIDNLPMPFARLALFIPSIMHRYETIMVAEELSRTILEHVDFQDLNLVLTAITASSAREGTNYERLELLGDCILKLCTSVQLVAEYPNWHEGYLSAKKDHTVANSRLARAALETGLDRYILTKPFTGQKWRPLYNSDLLEPGTGSTRQISSKTLADVVEALIGAAFIDGGLAKALSCLTIFLPEIEWQPLETRLCSLYDIIPLSVPLPPHFVTLENLIGYHFTKPVLLIEAMTHPSFTGATNSVSSSYQRLEFLGDAVLDNLVVSGVFSQAKREYSQVEMYWLRAALVNADFLAFLAMEWGIEEERCDVVEDRKERGSFTEIKGTVRLPFWSFMRHSSVPIAKKQKECAERYNAVGPEIKGDLLKGEKYPWVKLSRLQPDKFFSDIVESLLGAVYLDSKGYNGAIESVAERIGILPYLRRILEQEVQLVHPKGILGQMVGNEKLEYVLGVEDKDEGDGGNEGEKWFTCVIRVGGREILKAGRGTSKDEVRTRAAEMAVSILKEEKEMMGNEEMEIDQKARL
ncbi:MAG: hypothetical protein M1812_004240 [Candelaria pacifica]|nr:MAG: hypothetical protein M1812_004240 [Candelaria pacifica]